MNEQELLKKGRLLALKIFAESYLISKGNTKTEELFADRELGEDSKLVGGEILVLHQWLIEEFANQGLSLEKIIEIHGEKPEENKLSNYEINELVRRADIFLGQLTVFKKYFEANHK